MLITKRTHSLSRTLLKFSAILTQCQLCQNLYRSVYKMKLIFLVIALSLCISVYCQDENDRGYEEEHRQNGEYEHEDDGDDEEEYDDHTYEVREEEVVSETPYLLGSARKVETSYLDRREEVERGDIPIGQSNPGVQQPAATTTTEAPVFVNPTPFPEKPVVKPVEPPCLCPEQPGFNPFVPQFKLPSYDHNFGNQNFRSERFFKEEIVNSGSGANTNFGGINLNNHFARHDGGSQSLREDPLRRSEPWGAGSDSFRSRSSHDSLMATPEHSRFPSWANDHQSLAIAPQEPQMYYLVYYPAEAPVLPPFDTNHGFNFGGSRSSPLRHDFNNGNNHFNRQQQHTFL